MWRMWLTGVVMLAAGACGRSGFGAVIDAQSTAADGRVSTSDADQIAIDAAAGTVIRYSIADTTIRMSGGVPSGNDNVVICGQYSSNLDDTRPLLLLDLSGVTGPVTNATLRMYMTLSGGSSPIDIGIYRVTVAWTEAGASWTRPAPSQTWTTAGGDTAPLLYAHTTITPAMFAFYDWNITSLVNEWLTGTPNFGLQMRYVTVPATPSNVGLRSREYPASQPELLITP
ncbi:MAG TPA: DNRLRE domain-containing protein [Kofleriaceae bacterium]|nr:DNRLRE domain-containing protein [Kofleriaceae bacterium]